MTPTDRPVFYEGQMLTADDLNAISAYYAESIRHQLAEYGLESWTIGQVEEGSKGIAWS